MKHLGVTAATLNSIPLRSLVIELRARFMSQEEIHVNYPNGGIEEEVFVKVHTLEMFLKYPAVVHDLFPWL